jgi:PAS domain S-box-containing protein
MIRTRSTSFIDGVVAWSFDRPLSSAAQYAAASVVIGTAAIGRLLFLPESLPWLLFIPATIGIALITGARVGVFAATLSTLAGILSIGSTRNPTWLSQSQWAASCLFFLVMLGLVALVAALRDSMRRARQLNAELVKSARQTAEREAFLSGVLSSSTDCIKVLDLDGLLTFMSEGGKRVMEVSDFNAIASCPWPDFWQGSGNAEAVAAIEAARRGEAHTFIGQADTFAGTPKWWHVAISPILGADGRPERILSVSRDITGVRASEEERDRFVRLAENSTDFVGMARLDGSVFYLNDAGRRMVGLEESGASPPIADFFAPEEAAKVANEVLPAVAHDGHWAGEIDFRHFGTGEPIPTLYSVFPITDANGTLTGYGTITRDFRSRKAAEEQLQLLNGEMSHRLKNTLTVVQAIASQTLGGADRDAVAAFGQRLAALANAHDVLLQQSWASAKLRDVAGAVLATFDQGDRLHFRGPDIPIGPRATLALSLLLHELATNATKYGALSVSEGHVELSWSVSEGEKGKDLVLCWAERGGPPASAPARRGFGSRIIRMGLSGSGGVDLRYEPEGLTAVMTAPLDQLQLA